MTESELRTFIADTLEQSQVIAFRQHQYRPVFLQNRADISLESLKIDSLAAMEICIAIEINLGVSIAPDALFQIGSLNQLVTYIMEEIA